MTVRKPKTENEKYRQEMKECAAENAFREFQMEGSTEREYENRSKCRKEEKDQKEKMKRKTENPANRKMLLEIWEFFSERCMSCFTEKEKVPRKACLQAGENIRVQERGREGYEYQRRKPG